MIIERNSDSVSVRAPAKLNLFLEVLGKRPDGYHDLTTVLCPISIFDQLWLCPTSDRTIRLDLELPKDLQGRELQNQPSDVAWDIPADSRNLVHRGVSEVQRRLGIDRGCHIRLKKTIPAAAGLGGGSSNAAAAVVACLIAWKQWDRLLATEICAELGSDIPFFLGDTQQIGMSVATGRGEACSQLNYRPQLDFMVTHPPVGCATSQVYAAMRVGDHPRDFQDFIDACESGQFQKIGAALFNALQSPASQLTEWIPRQLSLFSSCGIEHAEMSGSGSSCYGLVKSGNSEELVRAAAAQAGITRVYSAQAWYGDSIERQLSTQVC
jgi:4-diphosphocytidyl-2-C-methyl-D-erythritol kinase